MSHLGSHFSRQTSLLCLFFCLKPPSGTPSSTSQVTPSRRSLWDPLLRGKLPPLCVPRNVLFWPPREAAQAPSLLFRFARRAPCYWPGRQRRSDPCPRPAAPPSSVAAFDVSASSWPSRTLLTGGGVCVFGFAGLPEPKDWDSSSIPEDPRPGFTRAALLSGSLSFQGALFGDTCSPSPRCLPRHTQPLPPARGGPASAPSWAPVPSDATHVAVSTVVSASECNCRSS